MKRFPLPALSTLLLAALCAGSASAQNAASTTADAAEISALKTRLERSESRLQDWAQLSRYRDANAGLAAPANAEARVVFMGDSITDSWDDANYGGFFPGKPYVNRGISGQTTPQMLIRFHPDVVALRPRAVVILAGTNDIAGNTGPTTLEAIQDNLSAMAEIANAHNIKVVFASLLPVHDQGRDRAGKPINQTERRPLEQINKLNAWIKSYAAQNGHTYLDYYTSLVDRQGRLKTELSDDGLHANAKGYAVMAPLAEAAIARALKK